MIFDYLFGMLSGAVLLGCVLFVRLIVAESKGGINDCRR